MKNKFSTLLCLLLVMYGAQAQKGAAPDRLYNPPVFTDTDRVIKIQAALPVLETMYKDHAVKTHYPGLAFGIVADGKLIASGGYGLANVSKNSPATPQSAFRIASMTKSITALAVLQLRDGGKLRLDDPAYLYIPELKKVSYLTTDAPPVTIRHLLTHAAGFPEDNPWGDRQLADTDAELLKLITDGILFSAVPGVAYEYSNLGFALLGKIITNVSKQPYQQYINEHILKPLGMTHTYWEFEKVPAPTLAHGYRWLNNTWREETLEHDGAYGAMGGLITTIDDFSKYMALHMSAWPPRSENESVVLKRSSLREMHQPWNISSFLPNYKFPDGRACAIVSAYAYGLRWQRDCTDRVMIGHSGGLPGFGSQWLFLPDYGIGVVSFSNLTYGGTGGINQRVLDTLLTLAALKPRALPPAPILQQRKEELVNLLPTWNGAEQSGIFAENFFKDYIMDSLRNEATTLFRNAGTILQVSDVTPQNNLRGSFVMKGAKKDLHVFFTLTPENPPLIQEYRIREAANE
ncbi:MAG TPA: serine hydrolase domain-containing protein [Chitinophagaceae bacterium]|nr:serine hydrolase domain-containing protein [Chitinophagaceae bacterium]